MEGVALQTIASQALVGVVPRDARWPFRTNAEDKKFFSLVAKTLVFTSFAPHLTVHSRPIFDIPETRSPPIHRLCRARDSPDLGRCDAAATTVQTCSTPLKHTHLHTPTWPDSSHSILSTWALWQETEKRCVHFTSSGPCYV